MSACRRAGHKRLTWTGRVATLAMFIIATWAGQQLFGVQPSSARQKPNSAIAFENIVDRSGIGFVLNNGRTPDKHQIETMTGGVAIFDYNNDGLLDIYFANGALLPAMDKSHSGFFNRLYQNKGNGKFDDVTASAGVKGDAYAMGVATADYDNDGNVDLYVVGVSRNQLYRNNGDGTFDDVTARAKIDGVHPTHGKTYAVSAGWFDYDRDGLLDLFLVNYLKWSLATAPACTLKGLRAYCSPHSFEGLPNTLYRNNGDGTFTDVSEQAGIAKHTGKGMGIAFADYDNNGFSDAFVSNDTFRNFLFRNNGDGTFTEVGVLSGVAFNEYGKSVAGMGVDFKDFDNDGRSDIFETAMFGDSFPLYKNSGKHFDDVTSGASVTAATSRLTAWGNGIFDFDNDGWKDLFTANGAILDNSEEIDNLPYKMRNSLLRNSGDGKFVDLSAQVFSNLAAHRGAAFGDLDNDGRVDIVTNNLNDKPEILMNRSNARHHWLLLNLIGTRSNRDGLGARIKVTTAGGKTVQYNQVTSSVGYASSSDKRAHFGLGPAKLVDQLEIFWPSGATQALAKVKANQILTIKEPK